MAYVSMMASCWLCGRPFMCNPELVPTFRIRRTPDGRVVADPTMAPQPTCRACMERVNRERQAAGMEPRPVHPEAYEAMEAE